MMVTNTRRKPEFTWRRRKCRVCSYSITTYETLAQEEPVIVNNKVEVKPLRRERIDKAAIREIIRAKKEELRHKDLEQVVFLRGQNKTWDEIREALNKSARYVAELARDAGIAETKISQRQAAKLQEDLCQQSS